MVIRNGLFFLHLSNTLGVLTQSTSTVSISPIAVLPGIGIRKEIGGIERD